MADGSIGGRCDASLIGGGGYLDGLIGGYIDGSIGG